MSKNPFISRNSSSSSNSRNSNSRNQNPFLGNGSHGVNTFLPHGHTLKHAEPGPGPGPALGPGPAPGPISFEEAFPMLGGKAANDKNKDKDGPAALNFKSAVQKNAPAQQQSLAQSQQQSLAQSLAQSQQQSLAQSQQQSLALRTNMFLCPQRHEHRGHREYYDHNEDNEDNEHGEGAYDSAYTKYYND
jgi:hypothetical protein